MDRIASAKRNTFALGAALLGACLLAAPAEAQRTSLDSLAGDHVNILSKVEDTNGVVQQILPKVEGPRPITECGRITLSGSYRLINNLRASGDCIVILADFVTIDMAGFVITGDEISLETGTGIGDGSPVGEPTERFARNIKVHNGTVTNFFVGVGLLATQSAVVKHVSAIDNTFIGIGAGPSSIVTGNTASGNNKGFFVGLNSVVNGNTANNNGEFGFEIQGSSIVTGNTAAENVTGFIVSDGGLVQGNSARFNTNRGFNVHCAAAAPSNVIGNHAVFNLVQNLFLNGAFCNVVNNVAP